MSCECFNPECESRLIQEQHLARFRNQLMVRPCESVKCCMARSPSNAPFCIAQDEYCCADTYCSAGETCCGDACCPSVSGESYLLQPSLPVAHFADLPFREHPVSSLPDHPAVAPKTKPVPARLSATTTARTIPHPHAVLNPSLIVAHSNHMVSAATPPRTLAQVAASHVLPRPQPRPRS